MEITERTELLVGAAGVERLAASHVMVVGIGGVGSNCTESLARGGVGRLTLVDYDVVSASNINRQAVAWQSTLGRPKIEVARDMVADINPKAQVRGIDMQVLPGLVDQLLDQAQQDAPLDFVVDTADLVTVKVALCRACAQRGIEYLAALGSGNKFYPDRMEFADIYDTRVCPMCKAVRKRARKEGLDSMRVLYSPEEPVAVPTPDEACRKARRNIGTISYYPAIMGQLAAADALQCILRMPRA